MEVVWIDEVARVREKSRVAVRYKMERERRVAAAIAVIYAAVEGVGSVVSTAVVCRRQALRNTRLITAVRSGAACPSGTQHSLRYNLNPHLLPLTRRGRRRPRSSPHTSCYCTYVATSHATSVHSALSSL